MTSEEKQILFKDLCARLPYGVKCFCKWSKEAPNGTVGCIQGISAFLLDEFDLMDEPEYGCQVSEIKPYLRPMSNMTEEERNEYLSIKMQETERVALAEVYRPEAISEIMDWLNEHHFDFRGLIPMGLALEAPEGMYKEE